MMMMMMMIYTAWQRSTRSFAAIYSTSWGSRVKLAVIYDTSRGPGSRLLLFTRARESPSSTLLLFAILCEQKHHKITKRNGVASMIVDFDEKWENGPCAVSRMSATLRVRSGQETAAEQNIGLKYGEGWPKWPKLHRGKVALLKASQKWADPMSDSSTMKNLDEKTWLLRTPERKMLNLGSYNNNCHAVGVRLETMVLARSEWKSIVIYIGF